MTSHSNIKPQHLENLGNGSWHYNYDVKEVVKQGVDDQPDKEYEYESVLIWGNPTYHKVVKAILRSKRDETAEFALINKYNAYKLGLTTDEAAEAEYKAYLKETLDIKAMVRGDFPE